MSLLTRDVNTDMAAAGDLLHLGHGGYRERSQLCQMTRHIPDMEGTRKVD